MRKTQYKSKLTITALIMMLAIYPIFFAIPTVSAHEPAWTIPTYSYIDVSPNPIGVNQEMFVVMWIHPNPPTAVGQGGDVWRDMTLKVTAPDGNVENFGPWYSDATGTKYILYTPNQIGTYTFEMNFPGQVAGWYGPTGLPPGNPSYLERTGQINFLNDTFLGSSASTTLNVQADPIEKLPQYPMPTEYWTRPIEGQNTEWASITSHWLGGSYITGNYQPDGIAPNSPHILWTKPLEFGGIVGGSFDIQGTGFYSGGSYEGRLRSPIIMAGRLYYEMPLDHASTGGGFVCVDIKTGEELWRRDDISPSFAQLYNYESPNQHGVVGGLLWATSGNNWIGIDGFTGKNVYNFTGVPRGTTVYDHSYGEIDIYVLDYANRRLALWSSAATTSSNIVNNPGIASEAYQYRPMGREVDVSGSNQYLWNVSCPDLPGDSAPSILKVIPGDLIFGTSTTWPNFRQSGTPDPYTLWAINLDESRGDIGELLWLKDYHAPEGYLTVRVSADHVDPETRVFMMGDDETFQWRGYNLDTGNLVWGPVGDDDFQAYQYFGSVMFRQQTGYVAYGKIFTQGYGGEVHCYDTATGDLLWEYNDTIAGLENNWGDYPTFIGTIADGKVYTYNHEHSPNYPLYKGNSIRCIDTSNGNEIWKLMGWAEKTFVAEGCLLFYNYYDNQLYVVGKGPSQTTVTASPKVTVQGSSIIVEGNVIDISAGTKQDEQAARFPNGVPAVSDESMSDWMAYVYQQKPLPEDFDGVEVFVKIQDPNGDWHSSYVTTDRNGLFSYSWTPTVAGDYHVTAMFEGSESYYASQATTVFTIDSAPETTEPQTTDLTGLENSVSSLMTYALVILVIVIIALLIAIYSLLKSRK